MHEAAGRIATVDGCSEEGAASTVALPRRAQPACAYVVTSDPIDGPRFCDARATRGSAYCAEHRARCGADPNSVEGARLARELERAAADAVAPPGFAPIPVPETQDDDEARDIEACLDIAPEPNELD